jgi:cyclic dehypoxanthinyl futalosine synthase
MGISRKDALDCFKSDDLIGIGMEANAIRRRLHPDDVVTYTIEGNIDYAEPTAQIYNKIEDIVAAGGTAVTLQGEVQPHQTITWFEALFTTLKKRFPTLWFHSLSATEILTIAQQSGLSLHDTIERLHDAGLDSIPGNDAGILDDAVQHHGARSKWKTADWIAVHRTAHQSEIQTTVTITFGSGETIDHRINHFNVIHHLQDETGGFTAFTPCSLELRGSSVRGFEEATAVEYLKTLAISRIALDNIENIQSNLETQGLKVLQVGLLFGGNDVGSVMLAANAATEEQLRLVIRDAGFRPVQRDTLYRTMFLN